MNKKIIICSLAFFILPIWTLLLYSLDISMEIEPSPAVKQERFSVVFIVDHSNPSEVKIGPPKELTPFMIKQGPFIRPYTMSSESGERKTVTRITYTMASEKAGRFPLNEFNISVKDKTVKTDPLVVAIGVYENSELIIPYKAQWQVRDGPIYKGESLPIVLQLTNLDKVVLVESLNVKPPEEGFFEQVETIEEINREHIGDDLLLSFPAGTFIFTPTRAGEIEVPGAEVKAGGMTIPAEAGKLRIEELPQIVESSAAIGRLQMDGWVHSNTITMEQELLFSIQISGKRGNFNYLQMPEPDFPGFLKMNQKETLSIVPGKEGWEGFRRITYTLIPDEPGRHEIVLPEFPVLDPFTGEIIINRARHYRVDVMEGPALPSDEGPIDLFPFEPKSVKVQGWPRSLNLYLDFENYLWLTPGPAVFLLFLFLRKKFGIALIALVSSFLFLSAGYSGPAGNDEINKQGLEEFRAGNYLEALTHFEQALKEYPDRPEVFYNSALAYYRTGRTGRAVYAVRIALDMDPLKTTYRNFLHYIEEKEHLHLQVALPFYLHPDLFFLVLIICINSAGFVGVFFLLKKHGTLFIITVLFLSMAFFSMLGLGYTAWNRHKEVGIVAEGSVEVLSIPKANASVAFMLVDGEAVKIQGKSNSYLFIETGSGNKGWILEDTLYLINREISYLP